MWVPRLHGHRFSIGKVSEDEMLYSGSGLNIVSLEGSAGPA